MSGRAPRGTTAPPSRSPDLLFAYGTLMRGYGLHKVLARGARFVAEGRVRGTLLDLGRYPGLVDGRGSVAGEIYRVDGAELLSTLDAEEGYNFVRRTATVRFADGRRGQAWVYRYRGPRERAARIPGGDYRRVRSA